MATLSVGADQQYVRIADAIAAASDGDIIAVQAGTYVNDFATVDKALTIQGVGGMVKMVATEPIPNGKAMLVVRADLTVDHIEFAGASVTDHNGAAIRLEAGDLTVTNSYFHDNENGILTGNGGLGNVAISHSEFAKNGFGDGFTHGIYIGHIESLTVTDSYFHDTKIGHHIKSRAETTVIENNRIDDANGTASYDIDLPNGGGGTIRNNIIIQGPNTDNNVAIHYGGESAPYPGSSLIVSNNVIENFHNGGTAINNQTALTVQVSNNQFYQFSTLVQGPGTLSGNTTLSTPVTLDRSHPWSGPGAPNDPPNAADDSATATANHALKVNILANDIDFDLTPLTITGVTQAAHGSVTINADKTVTYTPVAGFTGVDTFTYGVSDGQASDTASVSVLVAPQGATLQDKLALAPGDSWVQVSANSFQDVWTPTALQTPGGSNDPRAVIFAWSGFAWDSNRNDLILWGGGHANYAGNEVYRWDAESGNWQRASLPSAVHTVGPNGHVETVDGIDKAPVAAHAYDSNEFLPIADRFVTFGGAAFNTGGAFLTTDGSRVTGPYFWDPSKADANKVGGLTGSGVDPATLGGQMWQNRDSIDPEGSDGANPASNSFGLIGATTDYATENGKDVVYIANQDLWKYTVVDVNDPSKDTFEKIGAQWAGIGGQGVGAVDTQHGYYVRTNDSRITVWDLATAGPDNRNIDIHPIDLTGKFDFNHLSAYGMDYDTRRGQLVLWDGGSDVWILKPPTTKGFEGWTLTQDAVTGMSGGPAVNTDQEFYGVIGKWKYVDELDIFLGVTDPVKGTVWAYKPNDWAPNDGTAPPPPPPPQNDSVTGTTGSDSLIGTAASQVVTGGRGNDTMTGNGGHDTFVVNAGDGNDTITDFVGAAAANAAAEGDILKFAGSGLTAANMHLTQVGADVLVSFDGATNVLTLKNTTIAVLDNKAGSAYGLAFDGQFAPSDSFDVNATQVTRANSVTFLTDGANTVTGLDNSADVINGQGGNDAISGLSGNDILRGDAGNDILDGGAGNDRLDGGTGDDKLTGGAGDDTLTGGGGDIAVYAGLAADYAITMGSTVTIKDRKPEVSGDDGTDTLTGIAKAQFSDRMVFLDGTNNAPIAVNDTASTNEDTIVTGKLFANDIDFDSDALRTTVSTFTSAHGATVTLAADGSYSYDPRAAAKLQALDAGSALTDTFSYTVNDGRGGTSTAQMSVTVAGVTDSGSGGTDPTPPATVTGTEMNDKLTGHDNVNDTIDGMGGHDTLSGLSGDDALSGGSDNDTLYGGAGNDRLDGGNGGDKLFGEAGNDRLDGGAGNDMLYGGAGNDVFAFARHGGQDLVGDFVAGQDKLDLSAFGIASMAQLASAAHVVSPSANTMSIDFGGGDRLTIYGTGTLTASDILDGGTGTDPTPPVIVNGTEANDKLTGQHNVNVTIDGKGGHDTLQGLSGDDALRGGSGNDLLYGGDGNDRLAGGNGGDKLFGEAGNDRLDGGAGNDMLYGGAGNDVFAFARHGGQDLIGDFVAGQDKIDLSAFGIGSMAKLAASASLVSTGSNTMYIDFGAGDRLTIYGISKLTPDNVVF